MPPIIQVKQISKKFQLAQFRGNYIALRDILGTIVRHPFRFLKEKAKNAAGGKKKEDFWALQDVSFEVHKGDVVGIIGHNGAGKSTLLKILSQITPPTTGEIRIRGRVGSLLEVGTGFHPELTGRENIYLNGAILGMTRKEIERKFAEIVEFAGIERFLDTPVKYYSSGMYVRLAFSVAAHVEPEVLIIDEVLAVGDAEFQKKCLGKMEEVTQKEGRTILFVSHNMGAIQSICNRCILLSQGKVEYDGTPEEAIKRYLNSYIQTDAAMTLPHEKIHDSAHINKFEITDKRGNPSTTLSIEEPFQIKVDYTINAPKDGVQCAVGIALYDGTSGQLLLNVFDTDEPGIDGFHANGHYSTTFSFPERVFNCTELRLWIYLLDKRLDKGHYHGLDKLRLSFSTNGGTDALVTRPRGGPFYIPVSCTVKPLET
ncbi:ATP-binding cassette domain-containing protein [Patescibacteria group bacterium]|nr:ATP-binding cassette domain-containing protein [Patescibacteria group bacterium]